MTEQTSMARNWPEREPGKPLYVCDVNPHDALECINPAGAHDRWRCGQCGTEGELNWLLNESACPVIHPPCPHCRLTPICAWDCKGIWAILSDPKVYIAGSVRDEQDAKHD